MSTPENPPAFPKGPTITEVYGTVTDPSNRGMTLRDYFAAKAMQAYVTTNYEDCALNDDKTATWAYQLADAMLAARNREEGR